MGRLNYILQNSLFLYVSEQCRTRESFLWEILAEAEQQPFCSSYILAIISCLTSLIYGSSQLATKCSTFPWILLRLFQLLGQVCIQFCVKGLNFCRTSILPGSQAKRTNVSFSLFCGYNSCSWVPPCFCFHLSYIHPPFPIACPSQMSSSGMRYENNSFTETV